jgi:hypothetical protein
MYTAYQWEAYTHVHITHRKLLFRENKRQLPRLLPTTTQRQSERVSFEMQISMAIWYRSTCAPYSPCLTITDRPPPPLSLLGPIVPIVPRFRLAIEDRQHSNKSYNWHPSDNGQKNPERLGQVAHQHSLKRLDSPSVWLPIKVAYLWLKCSINVLARQSMAAVAVHQRTTHNG